MATTTVEPRHRWRLMRGRATPSTRHRRVETSVVGAHVGRFGLGTVGLLLVVMSAWGGIIPFVGPAFGYSADGVGSWHWSLAHVVVSLVPGALAFVIGLMVLASARGMVIGRGRLGLATAGLIVLACGAWFAVAPWAWPVIHNDHAYFAPASPLRSLAYVGGSAVGPGLIVAACGAFFLGWASRHQKVGTAVVRDMRDDAVASATP